MKFPLLRMFAFSSFVVMTCMAIPVLSPLFGDHAVLQRGVPVPVWGRAEPGEHVVVRFGGVEAGTDAGEDGRWQVMLPMLSVGMRGELVCASASGRTTSLDVMTGDVWLCTGQSNMEWTLHKSANGDQEVAAAHFPEIRQFRVKQVTSDVPLAEPAGRWVVCLPETAGDFTAVGYFFARDLWNRNRVPQGLINASWGGTPIEIWIPSETYAGASRPELVKVSQRWTKLREAYPDAKMKYDKALESFNEEKRQAQKAGQTFSKIEPKAPSRGVLSRAFNAMVHPLAPFAIRAVVWYQGEANWQFPREYGGLLGGLIEGWRTAWHQPELPFVIVQLPGYGGDGMTCWPFLREGQQSAAKLPSTALVVTCDLGESKSIHPVEKKAFGERVSLVIRRSVFGEDVIAAGPTVLSTKVDGASMRIKLAAAQNQGEKPVLRSSPLRTGAFELAGADHKFYPAAAILEGDAVTVSTPMVPAPVALRYAWREFPSPVLFNQAGLPSAPFRTDDWTDAK
jgi:sialate O-acetylesterase